MIAEKHCFSLLYIVYTFEVFLCALKIVSYYIICAGPQVKSLDFAGDCNIVKKLICWPGKLVKLSSSERNLQWFFYLDLNSRMNMSEKKRIGRDVLGDAYLSKIKTLRALKVEKNAMKMFLVTDLTAVCFFLRTPYFTIFVLSVCGHSFFATKCQHELSLFVVIFQSLKKAILKILSSAYNSFTHLVSKKKRSFPSVLNLLESKEQHIQNTRTFCQNL